MYLIKFIDQEQCQVEYVICYLDVLNVVYGDLDIFGLIGWCIFDYNMYKDFGLGDCICYYGVMDMFCELKFVVYVYIS